MIPQFLFWQPVHAFLAIRQKQIRFIFFCFYVFGFLGIGLGFWLFANNLEVYISLLWVANKIGFVSLGLFLLTLIPGILQRFRLNNLILSSVVLFRRQIGILMYISALVHSMYLSTIPLIMSGNFGNFAAISTHEFYGSLAVMILFPVWLTSNDFAQKKLKKFWKTIQRLTYVAIIFIYLHVAAVDRLALFVTMIVMILELFSWIYTFLANRKKIKQISQ